MNKKAFSLVEIIIVISIVVLLSVVWVSINSQFKEKSENTKISSDIETLKNTLTQYKQENKILPLPGGNINFFNSGGLYSHDETDAFWVHGSITESVIPKKYMSFPPIDLRTNQYYAFGKTFENHTFEIAGILKENGDYIAKVLGDYSGEGGPYNLIREYNGPNFVNDASNLHLPYNPEEKILTAHISSFSWAISINTVAKTSSWEILAFTFKEKDTLSVWVWGYANIYYSDGSMSTLWDSLIPTELYFANMKYPTKDNLITKIKLALKAWTIWTKASKLGKDSEFEIYTTDSTAAVRGTIFWISKEEWVKTNITVTIGKVDIKRNSSTSPNYNFETLIQEISNNSVYQIPAYISGGWLSNLTVDFSSTNPSSYIEVLPWWNPKGVKIIKTLSSWISSINNENLVAQFKEEILKDTKFFLGSSSSSSSWGSWSGSVSLSCVHSFVVNGECVSNNLASQGWTLVWYAPFDTDTTLYYTDSNGNTTSTGWTLSGSLSFQDDGVLVGTWESLQYNINTLNLRDNFAIEMSVKGDDLKKGLANFYLLSDNDGKTIIMNSLWTKIVSKIKGYISFIKKPDYNELGDGFFYPIRIEKEGSSSWKLVINNTISVSVVSLWGDNLGNFLYIWTNNDSSNHWWWPIKDLKIYKK